MKRKSDTPNKTWLSLSDDYFGAPLTKYATDDYLLILLTVLNVFEMADQYGHRGE